jgi:flavin-dependent dehydrogenase
MRDFKDLAKDKTVGSDFQLEDNAKIAVIGGGPSGTFFSIFALKMAKMLDKKIDLTIFEPKSFSKEGPAGCNRCGGVISEHLVQELAVEGINIPPEVVQRGIGSYVLHTLHGNVHIESPAAQNRIATVYRGGGPKGIKVRERESFDNFLLQTAINEGASHVPIRIDGVKIGSRPVITSKGEDVMEADLVVGAFGVNSTAVKMFESLGIGYKQPKTTSAFITEMELGRDRVSKYFGNSIHFFLVPEPKNVKFAGLIPKGSYVTLCILGSNIDGKTVEGLLESPAAKNVLPENCMSEDFCKCFPKLSLNSAKGAFADRVVVIGDAGSTRLFKDGIGASYIMGKAAANTAIFHGIGRKDFAEHYHPVYRDIVIDNRYGRFVYQTTYTYKNIGLLTESMVNVIRKEQSNRSDKFARLSSMLWDTFTGNGSYKSIFMRGTNVGMHVHLGWEFLRALGRRIT